MRFAVISDLHVRIDGLLYGLDTQNGSTMFCRI